MRIKRKPIKIKKKIKESTIASGIRIDRKMSVADLGSLSKGQLVEDERGKSAIILSIEIISYRIEKHFYLKLSSSPKMILIIK